MLEPYLKQIQVLEPGSGHYNVQDFDFLFKIADHPKLDPQTAILLLDSMSKVYFNDPIFANVSSKVMQEVFKRFRTAPHLREYLEKFIKFGINLMLSCDLEVEKVINGKAPPKPKVAKGSKPLPLPNSKP